ncbi:MAG: TraR/DksA C4-type zinc finger protein [Nitrincola sp.]|nr:TraR/DksA C4-type zinc finger protein [Nitrincola sp.]
MRLTKEQLFDYCLESGEPIGIARLLTRPTAELCTEIKAMTEMKERLIRR